MSGEPHRHGAIATFLFAMFVTVGALALVSVLAGYAATLIHSGSVGIARYAPGLRSSRSAFSSSSPRVFPQHQAQGPTWQRSPASLLEAPGSALWCSDAISPIRHRSGRCR